MLSTLMFNCLVASRNSQRLAFDQSSSYFFVRTRQNIAQGLPRNAHFFSGISLIEVFDVSQAHRLKLIERQSNLVQKAHRHALRLEVAYRNITGYPAANHRSNHQPFDPRTKKHKPSTKLAYATNCSFIGAPLYVAAISLLRRDEHCRELQRDVLAYTRQVCLRPAQLIVYRFGKAR